MGKSNGNPVPSARNQTKNSSRSQKQISSYSKLYLFGYNAVQTVGWSYLLFQLITFYLLAEQGSLYDKVKWTVIIFQNAAVLEAVHALVGIVPSNPIITLLQVSSRVLVVCGVLIPTIAPRESLGLPLALFAWSVTEVIRYANYSFMLVNNVPYFVKWLRYTTFYVLYPIGVTGELLCLYQAQLEVSKTKLFTISMPNRWNVIFNYQYFLIFCMLLYIPLFPQMYLHMISQRKKVIGGGNGNKTKTN